MHELDLSDNLIGDDGIAPSVKLCMMDIQGDLDFRGLVAGQSLQKQTWHLQVSP